MLVCQVCNGAGRVQKEVEGLKLFQPVYLDLVCSSCWGSGNINLLDNLEHTNEPSLSDLIKRRILHFEVFFDDNLEEEITKKNVKELLGIAMMLLKENQNLHALNKFMYQADALWEQEVNIAQQRVKKMEKDMNRLLEKRDKEKEQQTLNQQIQEEKHQVIEPIQETEQIDKETLQKFLETDLHSFLDKMQTFIEEGKKIAKIEEMSSLMDDSKPIQ